MDMKNYNILIGTKLVSTDFEESRELSKFYHFPDINGLKNEIIFETEEIDKDLIELSVLESSKEISKWADWLYSEKGIEWLKKLDEYKYCDISCIWIVSVKIKDYEISN